MRYLERKYTQCDFGEHTYSGYLNSDEVEGEEIRWKVRSQTLRWYIFSLTEIETKKFFTHFYFLRYSFKIIESVWSVWTVVLEGYRPQGF